MTGRALTLAELDERRLELVDIKTQLRALGRRKSVVETEILTGRAAPVKGAPAEQLPLVETTPATTAPEAPAQAPEAAKPATATTTARTALQMREAVLAALRAAKGRRSGKVLATLLGESEQDVHECLMELIQRGEAHSARRGGYEATDKPQPQGRDIKPGKAAKKPAGKPAAKKAKAAAKGKKASKAAPPAPPPAAPLPTPAPQASRQELLRKAIMDELGHGLATFGELLTTCMRDLAWTSQHMPQTTEVRDVLKALCEEGKVVWDEAKKVYHLPPPPAPKKAKAKKAPEAPRPTVTVGEAMAKMLAEVSVHDWQQARAEVCDKIAQRKGEPVSVGPLLLNVSCDSNLVGPVLELLDAAGAIVLGSRSGVRAPWGKAAPFATPSATVGDEEIAHDLQALTRRYVRELVEDCREPLTSVELAESLELPAALIDSVLIELRAAQELLCDREGRWSVRSPKASAAARTAPLFDDVEPAPAIDGLEPEGDGS